MIDKTKSHPDFEAAKAYALQRLKDELAYRIYYHSAWHTEDEVLPQVEWLIKREELSDQASLWVRTAAVYHDLGFIKDGRSHESISAQLAAETLPRFGYSPTDIRWVTRIIMATRLPQTARTLPEQILADADLDVLGRSDFMSRNGLLRAELAACGTFFTDRQWFRSQLHFLESHRYFTTSACALRGAGKVRNMESLRHALSLCRARSLPLQTGPYTQIHPLSAGVSLPSYAAIR